MVKNKRGSMAFSAEFLKSTAISGTSVMHIVTDDPYQEKPMTNPNTTKIKNLVVKTIMRDDLLRLLRGHSIEQTTREGMVDTEVRLGLVPLSAMERRTICDALTRDVLGEYQHGYCISGWKPSEVVPGTSEWLSQIAANADRIRIQVTDVGGTTRTVMLADASPEDAQASVSHWLKEGITPAWEAYQDAAAIIADYERSRSLPGVSARVRPPSYRTVDVDQCSPCELDEVGAHFGLPRRNVALGGLFDQLSLESDDAYRRRLSASHQRVDDHFDLPCRTVALPVNDPQADAKLHSSSGVETEIDVRDCIGSDLDQPAKMAPVSAAIPLKVNTTTPAKKLDFILWVMQWSEKAGSAWYAGRDITAMVTRYREGKLGDYGRTPGESTALDKMVSSAKQKASTIAHLLPPYPG